MKICKKCGEDSRCQRGGCKTCAKARDKARYESNTEQSKKPLGNDYHLDHINPLALGGSKTDEKIQLLRATCNLQKNAKHPVDFMQSRGFLL